MTVTQMNTRIDASLKSSGDLAIRESGTTPSAVIRSVWEYAARNRHEPRAIEDLLSFLAGKRTGARDENAGVDATSAAAEAELQVLRGPQLVDDCLHAMGIDPTLVDPVTFENERALAFDEDWEGTLSS